MASRRTKSECALDGTVDEYTVRIKLLEIRWTTIHWKKDMEITIGEIAQRAVDEYKENPFEAAPDDLMVIKVTNLTTGLQVPKHTILESDLFLSVEVQSSENHLDLDSFKYLQLCNKDYNYKVPEDFITITGRDLTIEQLTRLSQRSANIKLDKSALQRVAQYRSAIEEILESRSAFSGINTGVGDFCKKVVSNSQLQELQYNLIRSHTCGVGPPISLRLTRTLLALRINVLAKGNSGISSHTLKHIVSIFNANCLSYVPTQGSVGASGDLAPLAHLALGMLGEGLMWSPKTGWGPAAMVLRSNNLSELHLRPKEGLSLINGTQLICAFGVQALYRAQMVSKQADIVAAFTAEAMKCIPAAFDARIHAAKPHPGQIETAEQMRAMMHSTSTPSTIYESLGLKGRVQDAYSIRCIPQVHGVVKDTLKFVEKLLLTEINSATDNPMVVESLTDPEAFDVLPGGNFHGEYPAKACDYLAIAVSELASISERRIERIVNSNCSDGLEPFLTPNGGLNSGFMMVHVTAAALTSENKTLSCPASVDSIPTSAGQEDHVSMGPWAARKALKVVKNVEKVLGIELLCAAQAIDLIKKKHPGLNPTSPLQRVHNVVRQHVPFQEKDKLMSGSMETCRQLITDGAIWDAVAATVDQR